MSNRVIGCIAFASLVVAAGASCGGPGDETEVRRSAFTAVTCTNDGVPSGYAIVPGSCTTGSNKFGIVVCHCAPTAPTNPTLVADYSMYPSLGADADGNGVVDLAPPANPPAPGSYIPSSWTAQLNACGTTPPVQYAWDVSGPSGSQHFESGQNCSQNVTVPALGTYNVTLTARYGNGNRTLAMTMTLKNYLIVSLGDSIASGEGDPDVSSTWNGPFPQSAPWWENESCHRSARSGPALAALALGPAYPHRACTRRPMASSRAANTHLPGVPAGKGGVLDPYTGEDPLPNGQMWIAQLAAAAQVLCPANANLPTAPGPNWSNPVKSQCRPIDALLLSAGANDVGFGLAATACSVPDFDCSTDFSGNIPLIISNGIAALPTYLATLNTSVRNGLNVKNIYFTEYPDPTHAETGQLCGDMSLPNAISDAATEGDTGFLSGLKASAIDAGLDLTDFSDGDINANEVRWLHDYLVAPLNTTVAAASAANGWIPIAGIADEFLTHGYCARTPWITRYQDSAHNQLNGDGTFHPNTLGHQVYGRHILHTLLATLPTGLTAGRTRGDVDGDGRADITLTGGASWTSIPVAFSNGDGTFRATNLGVTSGDGNFPAYAAALSAQPIAGDFNGDGRADVALTAGVSWQSIPVAFSNGNGTFAVTNLGITSGDTGFYSFATYLGAHPVGGDFDGDGKTDIALMHSGSLSVLPVAFSNGNGTFRETNGAVTSGDTNFGTYATLEGAKPVSGDFDGDGKADIALTGGVGWGTIPVAFSNGDGTFRGTNAGMIGGSDPNTPTYAAVVDVKPVAGDFNGDGLADIALTGGRGWWTIPVAFSNGDGTFRGTNLSLTGGSVDFPGDAAMSGVVPVVGDFNGDGVADIALTGVPGGRLPIAFSNGDGTFTAVSDALTQDATAFAGYATLLGATPVGTQDSRIVRLGDAFYDSSTQCPGNGVNIHCCPSGSAMVGADIGRNIFKCAPLVNAGGVQSVDTGTQRNGMHACPLGQVMVGLRVDKNFLLCQTIPGNPVVQESTDAGSTDSSSVRVCNDTAMSAMTGVRADRNTFTCAGGS